jgi:hypothetical protein
MRTLRCQALAAALLWGLWQPVSAQVDSLAERYAATITLDELREHLTVLASDAYMGRDTGKEGQKMAAAYLKKEFEAMGIAPLHLPGVDNGYFQVFDLVEERLGGLHVHAGGKEWRYGRELFYFNERLAGELLVKQLVHTTSPTVLAATKGLGGKAVLVEDAQVDIRGLRTYVQEWQRAAMEAGVGVVFIASDRVAALHDALGHYLSGGRMRLAMDAALEISQGAQLVFVDRQVLDGVLGKWKVERLRGRKGGKKLPVDLVVRNDTTRGRLQSENVLAYIEGSDLKDELLVITAHYDHVGVEDGEVYNGADDDGSGTVAIMEIAEAFAMAKAAGHGPRRSVLVMPVSGEEKGLLGSKYYSENPVFPLTNTIANLNIDMIGRRDSSHATSSPYVYVIGSDRLSTDLHKANEEANRLYVGLSLDYTFNAPDDPNRFYYRSDHYNFARKGVPAVFYFSGVHEDYHQPGDDVEKIEFDLLHKRTLLVFHTAWILANQDERPVIDKAE